MYNKNDPLVNSVKNIMEQNELRRRVEEKLCEELGIYSRKALPREHQANYDALLEERLAEAAKWKKGKEGITWNRGKGPYDTEPDDSEAKHPVQKHSGDDDYDRLSDRNFVGKNKVKRLKYAIKNAKGKHGPAGKLPEEVKLDEAGKVLPDLTQKEPEKKHSKEYMSRMKDASDKRKNAKAERQAAATFAYKSWGKKADEKKKTVKEALHPNQQKLDVHEPEKDKLTAQDFKMLRAKKTMKEEEQLDEVSKKTLKSYIKKASHDVATKSAATGRYAERANKEEDNRKKNKDYSGYQQGRKDNETADKMFKKSWKRREGIAKAVDKLEEMQDSKNPLPPAGAKERIQNKLGTGAKSSVDPSYKHQGATSSDREEMNKKMENLDEKKLTDAEMTKREELAKKMKKGDWSERYGKRGKEVMYATATKMAKKLAEEKITAETVKEEIAGNLFSKMNALHEANDEAGLQTFLESLTEEQISILEEWQGARKFASNLWTNARRAASGALGLGSGASGIAGEISGAVSHGLNRAANYVNPDTDSKTTSTQQASTPAAATPAATPRPAAAAASPRPGTGSGNTPSSRTEPRPLTIPATASAAATPAAPAATPSTVRPAASMTAGPSAPRLTPSTFRGNTPSVSAKDALGDTSGKSMGSYSGVKATGFASDKPAATAAKPAMRPAATPAADRPAAGASEAGPQKAAAPKPAANSNDPGTPGKSAARSDDESAASYFQGERSRAALKESLTSTISKILKG